MAQMIVKGPASLLISAILLIAAPDREFVFEKAPFPSCHASTIVEAGKGEFLAAWFGGSAEGRPDVAIWAARKSGGEWSEPFELARELEIASYNPVLFYSADRVLWLYYKFGPGPAQWTAGRRSSRDRGMTWSPVERLPAGIHGPIKNKPLVLDDGTVISGTSVESYRSWACWVERSRDHARTWTRHGPITVRGAAGGRGAAGPAAVPDSEEWRHTHGIIQPAIVKLGPKRLRMFVRATRDIGFICYADSNDGGVTWTDAKPTTLPNPNSGIDAVGLKDGRVVLIYNHTAKGRTPLNLAVSRDGENWKMFLILESEPGEYSYPAIIQSSGGNLHVTYTWQRKQIKHVEVPLADVP
jgi:predicted neuraminidase